MGASRRTVEHLGVWLPNIPSGLFHLAVRWGTPPRFFLEGGGEGEVRVGGCGVVGCSPKLNVMLVCRKKTWDSRHNRADLLHKHDAWQMSCASPQLELPRPVAAGDGCAVVAERTAVDWTLVPLQRRRACPRRRVPQLKAMVAATRQQEVAMDRDERAFPNPTGVAGQRATAHAGGGIPQLQCPVITAAEDGAAICRAETARYYTIDAMFLFRRGTFGEPLRCRAQFVGGRVAPCARSGRATRRRRGGARVPPRY